MTPVLKMVLRMMGVIKDAFWNNVTLLMHMNGNNGGVIFTDEKGAISTVFGNAQTSTAASKWLGSSGKFDGTGDYLTLPSIAGYDFGTGDFTIDAWVRLEITGVLYCICAYSKPTHDVLSDIAWFIYINAGASARVQTTVVSGSTVYQADTVAGNIPINEWHFLRLIREGTIIKCALNGARVSATTIGAASINTPSTRLLKIGYRDTYYPAYLNGYMQDLRITKGIARNINEVPSARFPNE